MIEDGEHQQQIQKFGIHQEQDSQPHRSPMLTLCEVPLAGTTS